MLGSGVQEPAAKFNVSMLRSSQNQKEPNPLSMKVAQRLCIYFQLLLDVLRRMCLHSSRKINLIPANMDLLIYNSNC